MRRQRRIVHDVVTPTAREARDAAINRRRRRYLGVIGPALALVLFGFFVPAPAAVRVAALLLASLLVPIAAAVGSRPVRPPR